VDWDRNEINIQSVKRRATSNVSLTRVIPLIPALRQLLEKMRERHQPPTQRPNLPNTSVSFHFSNLPSFSSLRASLKQIRARQRLGGLLKFYREAA
jgi:hypothetical protein